MDFKLVGSILLIVGTSIGAGMLALPIATAELGLFPSLLLLFMCWFVMTASAFLFLEINLWLPLRSHLVSMAKATLGGSAEVLTWIVYLLLLYSLLCAYIAGGGDFLNHLLTAVTHHSISGWMTTLAFTLIFSTIVCLGISFVDYVNRSLMLFKLGIFFLLIFLSWPFVRLIHLTPYHFLALGSPVALTVTMTSFGFAPIIPSLRVYFDSDVKKLKQAILIGSLIPLLCYVAWDIAIIGILPAEGSHGLIPILHHGGSANELSRQIALLTANPHIALMMKFFTPICVVTSFLGVALCLSDFLADGLRLAKQGKTQFIIHGLTFLPPFGIVLFWPHIFVKALEYAGIYCVILLVALPALMAWKGRLQRQGMGVLYKAPIGKISLISMIIFSILMIANSLFA